MRETLKRKLMGAHSGIKKKDAQGMKWVDKWVTSWPGQILITACQIFYTTESFNAINQIYNSEKPDKARAWKVARDEKRNFIEMLTSLVRKATSEVDRSKMVALITVMVHSRDIMEQLYKTCVSPNSFDWMKQLRFYFVP
jgi:dynein heavy chain